PMIAAGFADHSATETSKTTVEEILTGRALAGAAVGGGAAGNDPWTQLPLLGSQYRRPSYASQERIFFDLLAYAPGMNTSAADIAAVVESDALPLAGSKAGQIDAAARELIDKARSASWRTWTIDGKAACTFDGTGRFAYERTLPLDIKERVACDGK